MSDSLQIGIVAGGPIEKIPNLNDYPWINYWIGVDHGALYLASHRMEIDLAIGDFDSISQAEYETIQTHAKKVKQFPSDKDSTDLELAIDESIELKAENVSIFGCDRRPLRSCLDKYVLAQEACSCKYYSQTGRPAKSTVTSLSRCLFY